MADIQKAPELISNPETKFTPDDLIKKFEIAAQSTVSQKESDDHKQVIEHIKALKIGTEGVTEKWWKQLRDNLSDADKNLASAVSGNEDITKKLGIETALDAAKKGVDASVKKAAEMAEQAKNALEKGDASKGLQVAEDTAKKAATAAGVSLGAAGIGEVIRQAVDGVMKPLKAMGDMLGEFFKMIFGPFIDMFKGIWGGFTGKTEEKEGKKGEGIVDKAKKEIGNVDKIKDIVGKKKQAFMDKLSKEWGINFKDSEKTQKFEKVWNKYSSTIDTNAKNIIGSYKDGETVYLLDGAVLEGKASLNFIFDLVSEGIIPKEAIAMQIKAGTDHVVQFGLATGRSLLGFGRSELDQIFGEISMEELGQDYSNLSPQQKEILGYTIHHRFGLTTYLIGIFAGGLTNLMTMYPTWNERVGFDALKSGYNALLGKYDKAAEGSKVILQMLGDTNNTVAGELRMIMQEVYTKTLITDIYKKSASSEEFLKRLGDLEKLGIDIHKPSIEGIKTIISDVSKPLKSYAPTIGAEIQRMSQDHSLTDVSKLVGGAEKWAKGSYANPKLFRAETYERAKSVLTGLGEAIKNNGSTLGEIWTQMKNVGRFETLPGIANKTILSVQANEIDKFKGVLSRLVQESPNLVKGFFSNVSLVIVGGGALAEGNTPSEKLSALVKGFGMFVPFVGEYLFLREGSAMNKETGMPSTGYIVTASGMAAIDAWGIVKILRSDSKAWEAAKFIGRPVTMVAEFIGGISKTGTAAAKGSAGLLRSIKAGETRELVQFGKRGGLVGAVVIALVIAGKIAWDTSKEHKQEEMLASWKKEGLIDENGQFVTAEIQKRFATLSQDEKDIIAKVVAAGAIGKEDAFDIVSKNGKYDITFKTPVTPEQERSLATVFKEIGSDINFFHGPEALKQMTETLERNGYSKSVTISRMEELGIKNPIQYLS